MWDAPGRFWQTIIDQGWLRGIDKVLAAVSGGVDSMALLALLADVARPQDAPEIFVAHVQHGVRPEAEADLELVCAEAEKRGLPFFFRRLSLPGESPSESTLREARHTALREMAIEAQADAIALAHHQDDLAETFLLRLLRGSGLTGLGGFAPVEEREGVRLIRPLIDWPRRDIEAFARSGGIAWREDPSNQSRDIARNRIRHDLLPALNAASDHGDAGSTIARTARLLRQEGQALGRYVRRLYQANRQWCDDPRAVALPLEALLEEETAFAPYLLREMLAELLDSPYPPDAPRLVELQAFVLRQQPDTLFQSVRNVVAWISPERSLLLWQKPVREVPRGEILHVFQRIRAFSLEKEARALDNQGSSPDI